MTIDPKNKIEVFTGPETLNKATAEFMIKLAHESIALRGRFTVSLSGGSTPEKLFVLLSGDDYRDRMPWAQTFIFWGDERYLPLNDKNNNAHTARILLLDKIEIPYANIFPVPVYLESAAEAAKAYEQTLKTFFGDSLPQFDLIMLGIGENAHTASLFPHTAVIREKNLWVSAVYVDELNMFRITMTAPLINNARNILFLVAGQNKAEVLKTIFTASYEPEKYPAQLISPTQGNLYWFMDEQAAAFIE